MTELKRERKGIEKKAEVEARILRKEVDRLKGKVEEVRKEVDVRPKIRIELCSSRNRIEQVGLINDRVRSEDGREMQGEWTKVKGRRSKKFLSPEGIDV